MTAQEKIQKTSKTIYIGLMIGKVSAIVGAVITAIALICGLAGRPDIQAWFVGLEAGTQTAISAMLVLILAAFGAAVWVCTLLGHIFKDIQDEGTPFSLKHVARIKKVAWLALALSVLGGTAENLEMACLSGDFSVLINVDLMVLLLAAIIYCLAYVFDYGCKLQQESDETL